MPAVTVTDGDARAVATPQASAAAPAPEPKPAPAPAPESAGDAVPLRGPALKIVENMERSLSVPTATSERRIPVKLLDENRRIINQHLAEKDQRKSFVHTLDRLGRYPRARHVSATQRRLCRDRRLRHEVKTHERQPWRRNRRRLKKTARARSWSRTSRTQTNLAFPSFSPLTTTSLSERVTENYRSLISRERQFR